MTVDDVRVEAEDDMEEASDSDGDAARGAGRCDRSELHIFEVPASPSKCPESA